MNWNTYFMNIANDVKNRSKDTVTKVGAVIVNENNELVSTGYNGFPKGMEELETDWVSVNKHMYVIHAEANAILYAKRDLKGCKIYTTLSPCNNCAKLIAASGIKEVYYSTLRFDDGTVNLFRKCKIKMEKIQ